MAHLVANITFASTSFLPSVLGIVVAIVGVAIVVVAAGAIVESSSVVKLSFVAYAFHQDKASSVKVPVAKVTLFSSAHLLRENTGTLVKVTLFSSAHLLRENTDSVRSNQRIRPTAPSVPLK
ncbi:hypothetical protein Tco_1012056 [Tanacetum coccineum]